MRVCVCVCRLCVVHLITSDSYGPGTSGWPFLRPNIPLSGEPCHDYITQCNNYYHFVRVEVLGVTGHWWYVCYAVAFGVVGTLMAFVCSLLSNCSLMSHPRVQCVCVHVCILCNIRTYICS